jgi:homoserine O-acetyltransferase/O-succinyltransferase
VKILYKELGGKSMFQPQYHTLKNFQFQSGAVLEELPVEYSTCGVPKKDSEGNILNGILFLHGWSGDYTSTERYKGLMNQGEVFDRDKYFVISTTALGSPNTASPSTSPLRADFPHYTLGDMVKVQYLLLKDRLKIRHLKGVVGTSMGGFQALEWGVRHPDFMDFLIPIVTSSAVKGRNLAIFKLMNSIIQSHPQYKDGKYLKNPENALENVNKLSFLFAFSPAHYEKEFPHSSMLSEALDEQGVEGRNMDANDVIWRNDAAISFDIRDQISKIRAKTLVIGIRGDQFFPPELDAIPLSESIKNCRLLLFNSSLGHLGINELEKFQKAVEDFISSI